MSVKTISLTRRDSSPQGTPGVIVVPTLQGTEAFYTLELPWRNNLPRISCIPAGTYIVTLNPTAHLWSPRSDGKIFQIMDVPGRSECKIHAGNFAGNEDLGYKSDFLGCVGIGSGFTTVTPVDHSMPQTCLMHSRNSLSHFMSLMGDTDFQLVIREGEH